ncbi:hypothetical protein RRG08_051366 [Elysia crispata]|uniref:Uncharacterized protein n=1 Tax=Elysia crispata TaxID=231223 RepID=A0AAE1B526_9GAST|nr:hypothetical protein RRG08_051366 [Elysia crispata]
MPSDFTYDLHKEAPIGECFRHLKLLHKNLRGGWQAVILFPFDFLTRNIEGFQAAARSSLVVHRRMAKVGDAGGGNERALAPSRGEEYRFISGTESFRNIARFPAKLLSMFYLRTKSGFLCYHSQDLFNPRMARTLSILVPLKTLRHYARPKDFHRLTVYSQPHKNTKKRIVMPRAKGLLRTEENGQGSGPCDIVVLTSDSKF